MAPMPQPDRDPLAATRRLLVDGTNLLHAISKATGVRARPRRRRSSAGCAARSRRRSTIDLVFDGPPERGLRNERIAPAWSSATAAGGRRTPSSSTMIDDVRLLDGADGTAALLVVTDDRDLRHGARLRGARTAGSAWLLGRLGSGRWPRRRSATRAPARPPRRSPEQRRPARSTAIGEMDRRGWKPGRGATTKKGNPRKGAQRERDW